MAKLDRLLNLTAALIETDVALTAEEIRQKIPSYPESETAFHRAFERDKDDLRALGIPIETVMLGHMDPPRSGYKIDRSRYELTDPGLTPEELTALHLAAAAVTLDGVGDADPAEALRKLGGSTGAAPTSSLGSIPAPPGLPEAFAGVLERRELSFDYGGNTRRIRPYRLQYERGNWYLSGHDLDREARRSFRLDRIASDISSGPEDAFDAPEQRGGVVLRPWELGDTEAVPTRVLLDANIASTVLAEHPGLDVVEHRPDGAKVVELSVRNPDSLRTFVLGMLDRAELLSPAQYRDDLVAWLEEFSA